MPTGATTPEAIHGIPQPDAAESHLGTAKPTVKRASLRERDDAYPAVAYLNANLRVIECNHGLQWVLQSRTTRTRWGNRIGAEMFFATKAGLLLWINERECDPDALAIIKALPDNFVPRGGTKK